MKKKVLVFAAHPDDELLGPGGTLIKHIAQGDEVSVVGRNTQGVRIIRLKENENLVSLARIAEPQENEDSDSVKTMDE